jgi:hypothetical protein
MSKKPDAAGDDEPLRSGVVTVVLSLLTRHLERGEVVGHGEIVSTGQRQPVRNANELVSLLLDTAAADTDRRNS